jgi:hypothetical protein
VTQRISQQYPDLPPRSAGHFQLPTRAEFLHALGQAANTCVGWKYLPFTRYSASWTGDIYRTKTFGRDDPHLVNLLPQPRIFESYVGAVIHYQAGEVPVDGSDTFALANGWSIEAELYTFAGVGLDTGPACQWTTTNGTLPTAVEARFFEAFGRRFVHSDARYPLLRVTTGMAPAVSPVGPTRPRPLVIPDTNAGAELQLRLTTTNVRIVAVDAFEIYREELP